MENSQSHKMLTKKIILIYTLTYGHRETHTSGFFYKKRSEMKAFLLVSFRFFDTLQDEGLWEEIEFH